MCSFYKEVSIFLLYFTHFNRRVCLVLLLKKKRKWQAIFKFTLPVFMHQRPVQGTKKSKGASFKISYVIKIFWNIATYNLKSIALTSRPWQVHYIQSLMQPCLFLIFGNRTHFLFNIKSVIYVKSRAYIRTAVGLIELI